MPISQETIPQENHMFKPAHPHMYLNLLNHTCVARTQNASICKTISGRYTNFEIVCVARSKLSVLLPSFQH